MAETKREVKSVVFKNFTDEEFVCSWDGTPYRFAPGKEMYVEDWKAEHFAKHLVDRVMHKMGEKMGKEIITSNMESRRPLLEKALPAEPVLTPQEALDINAREEIKEKTAEIKKGKASKKVVVEEEFAGLKKK